MSVHSPAAGSISRRRVDAPPVASRSVIVGGGTTKPLYLQGIWHAKCDDRQGFRALRFRKGENAVGRPNRDLRARVVTAAEVDGLVATIRSTPRRIIFGASVTRDESDSRSPNPPVRGRRRRHVIGTPLVDVDCSPGVGRRALLPLPAFSRTGRIRSSVACPSSSNQRNRPSRGTRCGLGRFEGSRP